MVIYELLNELEKAIQNSDNPHFEAELIIMSALKIDRAKYLISKNDTVSDDTINQAMKMAKRRQLGEPLGYILGNAEFMGMEFLLNSDILIPRPDTECLVEFVINRIGDKKLSVLDIGTGSGCIGISIAKFCKNTDVTVLDISKNALDTAMENAKNNGVRIDCICADILNSDIGKKFDVIVSNPPYIKTDVIKTLQTEVKDFEPMRALDGGRDGLIFYRRICDILPQILNNGGMVAFEIGYDERCAVEELLKQTGMFKNIGSQKDLAGNDRVVYGM
ncbi:MAG: peptide chain release factor N(5)-glutamine methyltransferase [Clostridia bacterium]|nr:peptide chain release factor N(5)-glutamine methyltransferase [Clostridia bacterium]